MKKKGESKKLPLFWNEAVKKKEKRKIKPQYNKPLLCVSFPRGYLTYVPIMYTIGQKYAFWQAFDLAPLLFILRVCELLQANCISKYQKFVF